MLLLHQSTPNLPKPPLPATSFVDVDTSVPPKSPHPATSFVDVDHRVPPKSLHVLPPNQSTPLNNQDLEQLKIDLKKARRTIGLLPIKKEDLLFWINTDIKEVIEEELFYSDKYEETRQKAAMDYLNSWLLVRESEVNIKQSKRPKTTLLVSCG